MGLKKNTQGDLVETTSFRTRKNTCNFQNV